MAKSFDELVKEGRDQGLDRAKAEARARDLAQPEQDCLERGRADDELWLVSSPVLHLSV